MLVGAIATRMPCPLCAKRPVVVAMCTECWTRTRVSSDPYSEHTLTDDERARLLLFEHCAPMTDGQRYSFEMLKSRTGLL